MDELLSRFPDIADDIFESLDDESLVRCKEASRSISSFMEEDNKFWKRIIKKYLHNQDCYDRHHVRIYELDFVKDWKGFTDLKQTKPEMLRELGRAVQDYLNRHEGRKSKGKCYEASFAFEGMKERCNHRSHTLSPLHVAAEAGNTLLYEFILTRTEDKNPIVPKWRFNSQGTNDIFRFLDQEWTPLLAAAR